MTEEPRPFDRTVLLVGGGKMGGALLQGWLNLGIEPKKVTVAEPHPSPWLSDFCAARDVRLERDLSPAAVDIVVLAIKPQMVDAAAPALAPLISGGGMLVSVVAGKTIGDLDARLPGARVVVRAMPNTPAAVGRGITGVLASKPLNVADRAAVTALLEAVGTVEWVATEDEIDAVTAVSGSGPAYVFLLTECLSRAGEAAGLAPDLAARLARATVEGAGELMFRDRTSTPERLRQNVTSPGGTTAAALGILMAEDGLQGLMVRAVAAAKQRARELAG